MQFCEDNDIFPMEHVIPAVEAHFEAEAKKEQRIMEMPGRSVIILKRRLSIRPTSLSATT